MSTKSLAAIAATDQLHAAIRSLSDDEALALVVVSLPHAADLCDGAGIRPTADLYRALAALIDLHRGGGHG